LPPVASHCKFEIDPASLINKVKNRKIKLEYRFKSPAVVYVNTFTFEGQSEFLAESGMIN